MKKETWLNKRNHTSTKDVAKLFQIYGITAEDLKKYLKEKSGTFRKTFPCPRCGKMIEIEVNVFDGSGVCPCCENDIRI